MRPTVIRLIAGCFLGAALSVSLVLPGMVVLSDQAPIQHLGLPKQPAPTVVRAVTAPLPRPSRAPAPKPIIRRYVAAPEPRPIPVVRVVHRAPARPHHASRPVVRVHAPPTAQQLQPLAVPPVVVTDEKKKKDKGEKNKVKQDKKDKKDKKDKGDKPEKSKDSSKGEKPKNSKDWSQGDEGEQGSGGGD